jgi:hypothetical protein
LIEPERRAGDELEPVAVERERGAGVVLGAAFGVSVALDRLFEVLADVLDAEPHHVESAIRHAAEDQHVDAVSALREGTLAVQIRGEAHARDVVARGDAAIREHRAFRLASGRPHQRQSERRAGARELPTHARRGTGARGALIAGLQDAGGDEGRDRVGGAVSDGRRMREPVRVHARWQRAIGRDAGRHAGGVFQGDIATRRGRRIERVDEGALFRVLARFGAA